MQESQERLQQQKAQWDQLVGRATDLESALEQWQAAYADLQQQLDASQVQEIEEERDRCICNAHMYRQCLICMQILHQQGFAS